MSNQMILDALRRVEFFHGIADEHLERLVPISRLREFPSNEAIFLENEAAKDVYLILSGKVSLIICAPKVGCRQLMEVGAGELISWSPLVKRTRLSDTARTLTPTKAIALDGDEILELCASEPEFGFEFMRRSAQVLAQRLAATRLQLLEMSGGRLPEAHLESD